MGSFNTEDIKKIVNELQEQIHIANEAVIHEVIGVSMAIGKLREALDKVENCLDERKFEQASQIGYKDIASEFVFLQRTLGSLQSAYNEKHKLVQDVALKASVPYETAEPFITQNMGALIPLEKSEKLKNKEAFNALREFEKNGEYIDHERVKAWLKTWGTEEEKPSSEFIAQDTKD